MPLVTARSKAAGPCRPSLADTHQPACGLEGRVSHQPHSCRAQQAWPEAGHPVAHGTVALGGSNREAETQVEEYAVEGARMGQT